MKSIIAVWHDILGTLPAVDTVFRFSESSSGPTACGTLTGDRPQRHKFTVDCSVPVGREREFLYFKSEIEGRRRALADGYVGRLRSAG